MDGLSASFATTPSSHAARLHAYIWPPFHPWPPHSPSPALVRRLHAYAAVHIFTAIYLPYSFIVSTITMLVAIGLRVGFPNCWRYSLVLGMCGWVPTSVLAGLYAALKARIRVEREVAWGAWGTAVDRRILEFESLHGSVREEEIAAFIVWVREGEGLVGSSFTDRGPDEESAIGPALTDEEYQASWRSPRRLGEDDSDDSDDESWNMHGTVLRDLHMAVHWRQNADEQERAHGEAQERARFELQVVNSVSAETSSHPQSAVQGNGQIGKMAKQPLLDIDLGDSEMELSTNGIDDSESKVTDRDNVRIEQYNKINTV
jgi:hypothetical protein